MNRFAWVALALIIPFPAMAQPERVVPETIAQVQFSYAPVVAAVSPAVVNVYATRVAQQRFSSGDPFFDRFFNQSPFFTQRPRTSQSLGSGVIVSAEGLILTNNHVVEGATDIRVVMADGREYAVDLVLADPDSDLAALSIRLPDQSFPTVTFADSDAMEVGDIVLAIGNPFGVGQSVSSGIVSALARTGGGLGLGSDQIFIQTDAAINPGNSGGALVDLNGHLVGINTAIFTRSGGSQGIGFAIPANMARVIADAAAQGGEIVRPWLGAQMQVLDAVLAEGLGLPAPRGALVVDVAEGGPAAQAGLVAGDVVTAIDDFAVSDPETLNYRVATQPVGRSVRLAVARGGDMIALDLTIAPPPPPLTRTIDGNTRFAGAEVSALAPALSQTLGLAFSARGIAVMAVQPGSAADALGLRAGDIILSLNGIETRDIDTFVQTVGQRSQNWQIILQRDGRTIRSVVSG